MKTFLAKYWYLLGILSVVLLALCKSVGWYALVNGAVFGGAAYLVFQAARRYQRLMTNKEAIRKMKPRQKEAFLALDAKESASIQNTWKMMPYLCFGCLFLNGYTFYYNLTKGKSAGIFPGMESHTLQIIFLIAGMVFGVLFYFAWNLRMDQTRIDQAQFARKKLKMK